MLNNILQNGMRGRMSSHRREKRESRREVEKRERRGERKRREDYNRNTNDILYLQYQAKKN